MNTSINIKIILFIIKEKDCICSQLKENKITNQSIINFLPKFLTISFLKNKKKNYKIKISNDLKINNKLDNINY